MQQVRLVSLDKKKIKLGVLHPILAFALPFLILAFAYAAVAIFPFGDRQILTIDLYHQYAPFMRELRAKILSGEGLFFSWAGGLGVNFYPLYAYYLASPLNLLLILFPEGFLAESILLLTLLKVGLAGFSMYFYLRKGKALARSIALSFSAPYALSAFVLAYSWNVMWLDVIALLPFLIYTCHLIIKENRYSPYIFTLALCILSNYYLAFFVCLFLVFYFPATLIAKDEFDVRDIFKKLLSFAAASLIGGMISAILIYPTFQSLRQTSAAHDVFPSTWQFKHAIIDLFRQLFLPSEPQIRSGMPNIYVGVFVLLLLPIYYFSKRLSIRDKIAKSFLLGVLVLAFSVNGLDFIWHGLHYPNQLPFRYAFLLCFLILEMSAEAYDGISWTNRGMVFRVFASVAVLTLVLQKIDMSNWPISKLALTFLFLAFYLVIIAAVWRRPKIRAIMASLMFFLIAIELSLNSFMMISSIAKNEYYGLREGYAYGSVPREIREAAKELQDNEAEQLVRVELRPRKAVNDPMLYGLNGFSIFSSSFPKAPITYMGRLGFPINGVNSYEYTASSDFINSLLGIRYLINSNLDNELTTSAIPVFEGEAIRVYEFKNALPLAFVVNRDAENLESELESPFINQNILFKRLFSGEDLFTAVDINLLSTEAGQGMEDSSVEPSWKFNRDDNEQAISIDIPENNNRPAELYLELNAQDDASHFLFFVGDYPNVNEVAIKHADSEDYKVASNRKRDMLDLGKLRMGDSVKVRFKFSENDRPGNLKIYAAKYDGSQFIEAAERVKARNEHIYDLTSSSFAIDVKCSEPSYLFVSTTYDRGWHSFVNGRQVAPLALGQCFLLIPLDAGSQQVILKFVPEGFKLGMYLTLLGLLAAFAIAIFEILEYRRQKQALAYEEEAYDEFEDELYERYEDYDEDADESYRERAARELEMHRRDRINRQKRAKQEMQEAMMAAEYGSQEADFINSKMISSLKIKKSREEDKADHE